MSKEDFKIIKNELQDKACDDVILWVENPYYQDEVIDVKTEYITDNNGVTVKHVHFLFDGLTDEDSPVMENLKEYSKLITELSLKEVEYFKIKDTIFDKEQWMTENTDFKQVYGKNNVDIRKQHFKKFLKDEYAVKRYLEISIDYLKRRISFLKRLIATKNTLENCKKN